MATDCPKGIVRETFLQPLVRGAGIAETNVLEYEASPAFPTTGVKRVHADVRRSLRTPDLVERAANVGSSGSHKERTYWNLTTDGAIRKPASPKRRWPIRRQRPSRP